MTPDEIARLRALCGPTATNLPTFTEMERHFTDLVEIRAALPALLAEFERLRRVEEAARWIEAQVHAAEAWSFAPRDGNAGPLHAHEVAGIWDVSNGPPKGGTLCEWCAAWASLRAALAHTAETMPTARSYEQGVEDAIQWLEKTDFFEAEDGDYVRRALLKKGAARCKVCGMLPSAIAHETDIVAAGQHAFVPAPTETGGKP